MLGLIWDFDLLRISHYGLGKVVEVMGLLAKSKKGVKKWRGLIGRVRILGL